MEMKVNMPRVMTCEVDACAYNKDSKCHARAITIGDDIHPRCDTFFSSNKHVNSPRVAGVGACKVVSCCHNHEYECSAESITVEPAEDMADCMMFEKK